MRTGAKALAMLAGASLALSACAADDSSDDAGDEATTAPVTFTYGYEQEYAGYNGNTADGNSAANNIINQIVQPGFWVFGADGTIVPDTEFGTYEKTADEPLTVKYTFNEKAAWSDGEAIDCDDAVQAWLAQSGLSGEKGFSAAGTSGYEDMNKPACADGDKEFTITYKKPFADWTAMFGPNGILPAHIVEKQSGVTDIIAAADQPTGADSLKAATVYNDAWNLNPGEIKADIMPTSGRYGISKWEAGQSLTLEANPKWWGTPAKAKTVVIRYLAGDAQVQALQNGEIEAMSPQPQTELVNQLKALGDQVKFSTHDEYTFEHFDFNFRGIFKDKNVREAFAKCIPRQQIVDNLVKPQNPEAEIQQSRYVYPFEDSYDQFREIGGQNYNTVDIAGSKQLLAAAGLDNPEVRVGWRKDPAALNKRRVDTVALLQASCKEAGFNVVDAGTADFFEKGAPEGNFDVAMFAWTGSPLVTGSSGIYTTKGESNFGKYTNKQVDTWTEQLNGELDETKQIALIKQIETQLWTDLATVPLFAFPAILATSPDAQGVEFNATQAELTWNMEDWSLAAQ